MCDWCSTDLTFTFRSRAETQKETESDRSGFRGLYIARENFLPTLGGLKTLSEGKRRVPRIFHGFTYSDSEMDRRTEKMGCVMFAVLKLGWFDPNASD